MKFSELDLNMSGKSPRTILARNGEYELRVALDGTLEITGPGQYVGPKAEKMAEKYGGQHWRARCKANKPYGYAQLNPGVIGLNSPNGVVIEAPFDGWS